MSRTRANSSRPSSERQILTAASAAPTRRRHGRGGEHERPRLRSAGTRSRRPVRRSRRRTRRATSRTSPSADRPDPRPEQLAGAGAARAEHAERVGLVDHQPGAVTAAQLGDLGQRRDVALHREDAVDDDQDAAAVAGGLLERVLEPVDPVVAEGAQLGAREDAAVEDRGVVAGVDDDGVAGAEDRPERAEVRLVAGGEDERAPRSRTTRRAPARARGAGRSCRSGSASR